MVYVNQCNDNKTINMKHKSIKHLWVTLPECFKFRTKCGTLFDIDKLAKHIENIVIYIRLFLWNLLIFVYTFSMCYSVRIIFFALVFPRFVYMCVCVCAAFSSYVAGCFHTTLLASWWVQIHMRMWLFSFKETILSKIWIFFKFVSHGGGHQWVNVTGSVKVTYLKFGNVKLFIFKNCWQKITFILYSLFKMYATK